MEEAVLKLLDSEIENVRDTQTRHGWTSWGLVGGVIGSLWLLSEELKFADLKVEVVATAVLVFSALIDSLKWAAYLVWQSSVPKNEQIRFRWSNEFFSGNEVAYGVEILRSVGVLVVAFLFAPMWWFPLSTLTLSYVWYLFLAISWIFLTKSEFAIRQDLTKAGVVFILVFVIPAFVSSLAYLRLAPFPSGKMIPSYRVGGLLVAISNLTLSLQS
jgi:hypothetical protein